MAKNTAASAEAQPNSQPRSGAQIVVDTLREMGVDTVFGYLGGVVLPLFDALYDSKIEVIIPRHEQGGTHMADAYARSTGKVGVVIATSGPGATNLTTGIATAMLDSVPMVAITGQVRTNLIGNDAFQEVDTTGITRPITKHNVIVKDVKNLARTIREAFEIASTGKKGPVLIDLPVDVSVATHIETEADKKVVLPGYKINSKGHARQIEAAARAINQSQRPLLYVGGGIIAADASPELNEFIKKAHIPITTTLMGLGSFDQNLPESLDMLGMHGAAYANYAVQNTDLLIAIGSRFEDRVTGKLQSFAPKAKIVHVDIDPSNISKNLKVEIPVVGDAKVILKEFIEKVEYAERAEWFDMINGWKEKHPFSYDKESDIIKPQYVIEEVYKQTKGDALVCTGVGQHQMWAAQFYKYKRPRQLITSGGLGTMGFGLPAAIGAKIACPDATVIDFDGDSSLSMTLNEIATAVQYGLNVKICLLNNGHMGMVRQWQELFYDKRYSCSSLVHPDFAKVAIAYGADGVTITKKEDVPAAVEKMLKSDKPFIANFHVEPEENVWPMVAAGKSLDEMDGISC